MSHPQTFDKIDSFLKPCFKYFYSRFLILGWGEGFMKEGAGILHQIYRFTGGVNSWGSRIHQSKSWYYLGPSQTSKMEFFWEIVFSYKPLTLLEKAPTYLFDWFYKTLPKNTFQVFVSEILTHFSPVSHFYTP